MDTAFNVVMYNYVVALVVSTPTLLKSRRVRKDHPNSEGILVEFQKARKHRCINEFVIRWRISYHVLIGLRTKPWKLFIDRLVFCISHVVFRTLHLT